MGELFRRLRYYFGRRRFEAELDEEMQQHAALAGKPQFGNVTLLKEDSRAMWTWTFWEQFGQDLRYALRMMLNNKTFTVLAVLSLALGIGANTAIFSFMEALLLRSLPVPEPESLVVMKWRAKEFPAVSKGFSTSTGGTYRDPRAGQIGSVFPYPALELFQNNGDVLASAFSYFGIDRLNVAAAEQAEAVPGQFVSGDYSRGMGVPPAAGRAILPTDDQAGADPVAVVSFHFSERRFGGAGQAVGQSIRINNVPFTIVGVMPPGFFGADPASAPEVYLPLHSNLLLSRSPAVAGQYLNKNYYWIEIMGRLKSGVSVAQAQAALAPQFRRFAEATASTDRERADLPELRIFEGAGGLDSLRWRYSKPLYVLMAMVGLILLIACANIANLLLARAAGRRREIAVRLGLGASRSRVIRQLLTESVLLASLAGALGLVFALWGVNVVTLLLSNGRDNFTLHAELNWPVLAATFALSVLTGVVFGLAPALQATRVDVLPALKEVRAGSSGRRPGIIRLNLGQILVAAQIGFSLVLLVAAGLFGRTLANLQNIDLGFNRENVLMFTINPQAAGYEGPELSRLYASLQDRLGQVPGVRSASMSVLPLLSGIGTGAPATITGAPPNQTSPAPAPAGSQGMPRNVAGILNVGPDFFETMQIPLRAGRGFKSNDAPGAPPVAVINERLAKLYGVENPLGRTVKVVNDSYQIVGVVSDALWLSLKQESRPMVYLPYSQNPRVPTQMWYEVRAAGNPLNYAQTVRELVRQLDSRIAVAELKSQRAMIDQTISQEITLARLCSGFAVLALVIACVGLYGSVAYHVACRTNEIGLHMALGAQRGRVVWMVLRQVVVLVAMGMAIGLPIAYTTSHLVESFLFGLKAKDPLTMGGAALLLAVAAIAAAYVPARRASRIDPMVALRHE